MKVENLQKQLKNCQMLSQPKRFKNNDIVNEPKKKDSFPKILQDHKDLKIQKVPNQNHTPVV